MLFQLRAICIGLDSLKEKIRSRASDTVDVESYRRFHDHSDLAAIMNWLAFAQLSVRSS